MGDLKTILALLAVLAFVCLVPLPKRATPAPVALARVPPPEEPTWVETRPWCPPRPHNSDLADAFTAMNEPWRCIAQDGREHTMGLLDQGCEPLYDGYGRMDENRNTIHGIPFNVWTARCTLWSRGEYEWPDAGTP